MNSIALHKVVACVAYLNRSARACAAKAFDKSARLNLMGKINQEAAKRPHLHILKIGKSLGSKTDALIERENGTAAAFTK